MSILGRVVVRLAVVLVLSSVLAACAAWQSVSGGNNNKVVRVGSSGTYPPFTFTTDGRLDGIEVDFARALANEIGRSVEVVQVAFPDLIGELNAGRIDIIMSGMSVTPRRSGLVSFTEPYIEVGQMALVRAADLYRFAGQDWTEMPGLRVGFERATTGSKFVQNELKDKVPVEFANKEDGLDALKDNLIDVFVHDAPFVWLVVGSPQHPNKEIAGRFTPLTDEKVAWAVRKGDDELLAQLNSVLDRWRDNGTVDSVLDKWIRVRRVTLPVP